MTNENQYFIKKMINNRTILEIQKMLYEGKTYSQIKEVTGVSDGTIARVKSGKLQPNRELSNEPLYTQKDIENLNYQLELTRKKVVELNSLNNDLEKENKQLKEFNLKAQRLLNEYKKYGFVEKYRELKKQEEHHQMIESQCSKVNSFKLDKKTDKLDLFNTDINASWVNSFQLEEIIKDPYLKVKFIKRNDEIIGGYLYKITNKNNEVYFVNCDSLINI